MIKKIKLLLMCTLPIWAHASRYDDLIHKHARLNRLDPHLVQAIMCRESAFNPHAHSSKDARGLMQVIPSTARLMGVDPRRLFEPEQSIIAGTRYLAFLSDRYHGNLTKMIAGYNAGHGAVDKYGGIPPYAETQTYVRYVAMKYQSLGGNNTSTDTRSSPVLITPPQGKVILTSWQQRQSSSANEPIIDEKNEPHVEPVHLHVAQSNIKKPSQPQSFVQTLDHGEYVSVF